MFTVRRVASASASRRYSRSILPNIESIEVLRRTRTRRAKLYFIRDKAARDQKRAMRKAREYVAPAAAAADAEVPAEEPIVETPAAEEAAAPEVAAE